MPFVALERELHEAVEQLPKRTPEASKTLGYMLVAVKLGIVSSGRSHPDPGRSHASGSRARCMWLDSDLLQSALSATGGESSLRVNGAVDLRVDSSASAPLLNGV